VALLRGKRLADSHCRRPLHRTILYENSTRNLAIEWIAGASILFARSGREFAPRRGTHAM
jgi:hypothetical protein